MVITELIKDQVLESTIMFAAGIALGMLHQLYTIGRGALRRAEKKRLAGRTEEKTAKRENAVQFVFRGAFAALEILFWLAAALFVSVFLYYAAYGDLSFHNFLALAAGVFLWRKAFYDIVY